MDAIKDFEFAQEVVDLPPVDGFRRCGPGLATARCGNLWVSGVSPVERGMKPEDLDPANPWRYAPVNPEKVAAWRRFMEAVKADHPEAYPA